jgi:hypothetical protein
MTAAIVQGMIVQSSVSNAIESHEHYKEMRRCVEHEDTPTYEVAGWESDNQV